MAPSMTWIGTATAMSSISHTGDTRGTLSLLRRERIIQVDGSSVEVPIISGNCFRGRLRRVGEELLRDVLGYEGLLPIGAAHALRSGGALAKTGGEPLSGSRLALLRLLVPQVGVFGTAGGGRIIDGCLQVGKLVPVVAETARITGVATTATCFDVVQLESYTRVDEADSHACPAIGASVPCADSRLMRFQVETFRAGTVFQTGLFLSRPTELEAAFFADVLAAFTARAVVGGRSGIGMGRLRLDLDCDRPVPVVDWVGQVAARRDEALAALETLA